MLDMFCRGIKGRFAFITLRKDQNDDKDKATQSCSDSQVDPPEEDKKEPLT